MRKVFLLLSVVCLVQTFFAQQNANLNDPISLEADHFLGVDSFGAIYYTQGNIFYKKWNNRQWQYGDLILGELSSVSILNPLKMILFYEQSNTVVIVDKYLTEIERINFNTFEDFKNVSQVSLANDRSIWIFDNNTQVLEVFNYDAKRTVAKTLPVSEIPVAQQGNFNFCWLLTDSKILQYNSYGSLLNQFKNNDFIDFRITGKNLILKRDSDLFHWVIEEGTHKKINLPEIDIKDFYVTQEILYIYDGNRIFSFQLNPKEK